MSELGFQTETPSSLSGTSTVVATGEEEKVDSSGKVSSGPKVLKVLAGNREYVIAQPRLVIGKLIWFRLIPFSECIVSYLCHVFTMLLLHLQLCPFLNSLFFPISFYCLGRIEQCEIPLSSDMMVSSRHCVISNGVLKALKSTNGTFINQVKVRSLPWP